MVYKIKRRKSKKKNKKIYFFEEETKISCLNIQELFFWVAGLKIFCLYFPHSQGFFFAQEIEEDLENKLAIE
jgi:predicted NAD-dependent protein-ADP-ribosyltransferase YbiA (DUF1768 family)